jgi:hypothetical protein
MNAEQRIQALEQELEILKNQIQVSLLDIQEYLLTNAYPALRSDAGQPPVNNTNVVDQRALSVSSVEVNTEKSERDPKASRGASTEGTHTPQMVKQATPSLAELQRWAMQQIGKMGVEGTQELIRMYAQHRHFTPETADTLLDFTDLYKASNEATLPSRPAGMVIPARSVAPQPKAQSTGARQTAPAKPSAPPKSNADQNTSPLKKVAKTVVRKTQEMIRAAPPAPPEPPADQRDDLSSSTVLRLIAGIQNAGAGVRWKKKEDG